jgi:hypothetical protein
VETRLDRIAAALFASCGCHRAKTHSPSTIMEPLSVSGISSPQRRRATNRTVVALSGTIALFVLVVLALIVVTRAPTGSASSTNVSFFVVGDWGREGTANQSAVAELMSRVALEFGQPPVAILSTGDNFYPNGLNSTEDPLFDASFSRVYTGKGLEGVPWFGVLGNHDYGDGFLTLCENDVDKVDCSRGPNHELTHNLKKRDSRYAEMACAC